MNTIIQSHVKDLRNNQTEAEKLLWSRLRKRQLKDCKFRRQHPLGNHIVDFICLEKKLIIELDGGQHIADSEKDTERDIWMRQQGYKVLRFWNNDVFNNTEGVLEHIETCCG
jgi:very-short-patch-repair endonuclease